MDEGEDEDEDGRERDGDEDEDENENEDGHHGADVDDASTVQFVAGQLQEQ